MDIEKLTKETILKNMTPEQQKAVLDSVMDSVAQSKQARTQKVAENVDLVLQALKKIEAKMLNRVASAASKVEQVASNVKDGKDGRDGKDGKDGSTGPQGLKGADGKAGRDGKDGKDGKDGVDGVSVTNAFIDFDNSLVIELSNGRQINVGAALSSETADKVKVVANGGGTSQGVLDAIAALQAEIDAIVRIPSQTGNAGKFLSTNGSVLSWVGGGAGLAYQGTWNASTNSPTLASGVGNNGYYYVVGVTGSTNLDGITNWTVGDWVIFNGTAWQKIDNTDLVTSVAGRTGDVTLSNSDVSGSAASGANSDITSLSGITGGISTVDYVDFDTAAAATGAVGRLNWNATEGTLDLGLAGGNVSLQVGMENVVRIKNDDTVTLTDGMVVYITGASGSNLLVKRAKADAEATSATTLAVMTESVATNASGYATTFGNVRGLNTNSFNEGEALYLSAATAGALTNVKPTAPNHIVTIGFVTKKSAGNGEIFVRIDNGYELDELHNVHITSAASGNTLIYDASAGVWKNASLTAGTGVSVTNGAGSITVTNTSPDQTVSLTGAGTTSITGTYPNFTITSNDAYTGTVTSVSGTAPITSTGGNTPTLSLASGYGDTQNPYASKTANYILAAPNGSNGVPTFRAIVAADIPTLNQNTTGSAATVTTTISSGATATTQASGDNSTKVATTAYVNAITGTAGGFGFKNRIINGGNVINQRAGGTVTIPVGATYITDRFSVAATTASKLTASQSSVAPAGFTNSLLVSVLSSFTTSTADDFSIKQPIEGFNVADLGFGAAGAATITLSFWVYSSVTGTYSFSLRNGAANRSYVTTYTINSANTWEQKTITITGDTTGTWTKDNTVGMYLTWDLGQGTNYNTSTTNAWQVGNYDRTSGSVSFVGQANGAAFYITGVQLEKGSTATSFDYRPYGTELALCQRYWMPSPPMIGKWISTTNIEMNLQLLQPMRATPTLALIGSPSVNEPGVALRTVSAVASSPGSNLGGEIGVTTATATNGAIGMIGAYAFSCNAEL